MKRALGRVPRTAWICALVACLNAVCWSILTPAFQVPDEPSHFAYVKQLAETGRLPSSGGQEFSSEEHDALEGLDASQVRQRPQNRTIASQAQQNELQRTLAAASREPKRGSAEAGVATSEPPLYYALEAIPYRLASSGTVLDRLQLMRLVSALLAGLTAMFVFLFVRETLPDDPWTWTVSGLAIALMPLLGFMSGAVNPDSLLFAISAAIFYFLARAFRRGLAAREAIAIGGLTAVGLLTKLNFIGLVPGVLFGLIVLTVRAKRGLGRWPAYRLLALAIVIACSPVVLYAVINLLSNHPALGIVSGSIENNQASTLDEANYVWQLYLPRLPGTINDFPGLFTTRQLWFDGFVGLYGWLDTPFPGWVDSAALLPAVAVALLCVRSLLRGGGALRSHVGELVVYAIIALGLMVLVGASSYKSFPQLDAEYAQARYLLPLLALFGLVLALAVRGAGRRFAPAVGMLLVVLFVAHDIFSQLQVVARFYG